MKIARRFKLVIVAGVYFPIGSLNGFVTAPDIAFYREGSRRWKTRAVRRAAKRGARAAALREARAEARP